MAVDWWLCIYSDTIAKTRLKLLWMAHWCQIWGDGPQEVEVCRSRLIGCSFSLMLSWFPVNSAAASAFTLIVYIHKHTPSSQFHAAYQENNPMLDVLFAQILALGHIPPCSSELFLEKARRWEERRGGGGRRRWRVQCWISARTVWPRWVYPKCLWTQGYI